MCVVVAQVSQNSKLANEKKNPIDRVSNQQLIFVGERFYLEEIPNIHKNFGHKKYKNRANDIKISEQSYFLNKCGAINSSKNDDDELGEYDDKEDDGDDEDNNTNTRVMKH